MLAWGWSTFEIVALYWLENVIIGVFNALKLITCSPGEVAIREAAERMEKAGDPSNFPASAGCVHGIKLFLVPFFIIHYGGFCAGHGFFVFMLLGPHRDALSPSGIIPDAIDTFSSWPMLLAIAGLTASHLFSFTVNYIGKGEYKRVTPDYLMFAPYGRIMILHVAIIFGGWGIMALGSPVALLILLVILKSVMDITLHVRSHTRASSRGDSTGSGTKM